MLEESSRKETEETGECCPEKESAASETDCAVPEAVQSGPEGTAGAGFCPDRGSGQGKHGDAWKLFLGILIGITATMVVFVFWKGYFAVPLPGIGVVTVKLPTYGLIGDSKSVIDTEELNRKMDEIDYYMDNEYYYKTDREDLLDAAVRGIYDKYTGEDDYAEYFTAKEYLKEVEGWSGSFVGIGIYVVKDEETGGVRVVRPIKNGPAIEAGMKEGDIIITADGTDLTEMDLDTAVNDHLKGEEGTKVHIEVLRDGHKIEFDVERRSIEAESVYYSVLERNGKIIGYMYISSFLQTTVNGFKEGIDYFESEGVDGVVIDLRDNGGGDMNTCLLMCDYILPDNNGVYSADDPLPTNHNRTKLLTVQGKNEKADRYYAEDGHSSDLPAVVLVNGYSASASEIFAGVMHSYGYRVCGLNTYGKGIVQTIRMLYDMSGIKYTSAEYILPDSSRIHGVGIEPDVTVGPSEELISAGADAENPDPDEDNMLAEAIRLLGE